MKKAHTLLFFCVCFYKFEDILQDDEGKNMYDTYSKEDAHGERNKDGSI